jgi:hypothetical protein
MDNNKYYISDIIRDDDIINENQYNNIYFFISENDENEDAIKSWIFTFFSDSYKDFCMHREDETPVIRDNSKKICDFIEFVIGRVSFNDYVKYSLDIITTHPHFHQISKYLVSKMEISTDERLYNLMDYIYSKIDLVNIDDKHNIKNFTEIMEKYSHLEVSESNYLDNRIVKYYDESKFKVYPDLTKTIQDVFKYIGFPLNENVEIYAERETEKKKKKSGLIRFENKEDGETIYMSNITKSKLMRFYSRLMSDDPSYLEKKIMNIYIFLRKNLDFSNIKKLIEIDEDENSILYDRIIDTIITMILKYIGDLQYIFPTDRNIFIKTPDRNLARLVAYTTNCVSMYERISDDKRHEITFYFPKVRNTVIQDIYVYMMSQNYITNDREMDEEEDILKSNIKKNKKGKKSNITHRRSRKKVKNGRTRKSR